MKKRYSATDIPLAPISSLKQAIKTVLRVSKRESDAQITELQGMNAQRRQERKKKG